MKAPAPFGRRACPVVDSADVGAYRVISVADAEGPQARPGQFAMLASVDRWGAGGDERPYLPRAFSYLSHADGVARFMLEAVGPGTTRLAEVAAGESLWVTGPLGNGFAKPPGRALLCGGGVGIPPLAALQRELLPDAPALLGFRDAAHAEAASLLANVSVATDDGSVGRHALVTTLLDEAIEEGDTVFACGPPGMLEAVRALCEARGVESRLALEAGMACGFGACYGCVVPTSEGYKRVCVDGPVLAGALLTDGVPSH